MADNILATALLASDQSGKIVISAEDIAGVYMIDTAQPADITDVAILIPGVFQAENQDQLAPLRAKNNGDGTYSLVTVTE